MSGYDYMLTTTYISITKQIAEYWEDYKSAHEDEEEETIQEQIEDFKYYYGNCENTLCYYDFDINAQVGTLFAQRFIIQKVEDSGFDMDMSALKRMTTANGLKAMLLYWIMEDFDFDKYAKEERYCDNVECPYGSYICFEELEKYNGKEWVCEKCSNEKIKCNICPKILRRKNMILHIRDRHSPQIPPTKH